MPYDECDYQEAAIQTPGACVDRQYPGRVQGSAGRLEAYHQGAHQTRGRGRLFLCDDLCKDRGRCESRGKAIPSLLEPDPVFWMAYPKKTSKKYKSEIHRDSGWMPFGDEGYEGVAMVSIDDNWSALRFRKVDFIKTMKRRESMVLSKEGKNKVSSQKGKGSA
jgi:hypothetical protein